MKQKLYFFVVLSMLIAVCFSLTACVPKAVEVDEQEAKEAVAEPVEEQVPKPAAEQAAEQVVDEVTAKEAEAETAAQPVAGQAVAKMAEEDQAVKLSVAEPTAKPADLKITRAAICLQVVDREPVDAGTSFESPDKLSCFTHVTGAQGPAEIYHVWYFAEAERAVVKLKVNSASWRTYSTKIIQPHEIGDWRVDVLGQEGDLLKAVHFKITP